MDCAPPRGASFDAVGQRWLAVFAFQAAFSAAASALHLTVSPRGRRHPLLGVPTGLLLGFHPFLACAATGMLALALLLSVSPHPRPTPLPRRALATALFAAAGALCVGAAAAMLPEDAGWAAVAGLGFRGAVLGAIFAARYFGRRRWLLQFPVVQVVHTRRCSFAPPQSTAAADTNPTEFILESLEQSDPRSLIQYLAYQDLCVASECNLEPWRRAAFFEESGETYKRIVTTCLKPLEEFTSKIAESLEDFSSDKPELMLQQSKLFSAFDDFQICAWCARTLTGLTACSRQEDRYGVAQLTGCNAAVMTTLLSALVAIETCLGKKTNPQPVHSLGPENIRWVNFSTGRKGTGVAIACTQKGGLHKKAYTMADVLRTSVYQIVSAFIDDLRANAKPSSLEKNWISEGRKPVYGSQAVLVQKLILFIEYRAV
uniref:Uncharacterized protein n=1 Tax=Zea mays TaxID=4577 RepID=A0A804NUK5_MAIZE